MDDTKQYCTFEVKDHLFGVDVLRVRELVRLGRVTPVPLAEAVVGGLFNLRGEIVMALDLGGLLGFETNTINSEQTGVVVEEKGETTALIVDSAGDIVVVDSEGMQSPPGTVPQPMRGMLEGIHWFHDRLLLVLDLDRVLEFGPAALCAVGEHERETARDEV